MATFPGESLQLGEFSQEAALVQRRLGIPANGYYDELTYSAVRGFQAKHGLQATGEVDHPTWLALEATVREGLLPSWYGTDLQVVQARKRLGLHCGDSLGTALRQYQSARGLPITGLLDEATAVALGG